MLLTPHAATAPEPAGQAQDTPPVAPPADGLHRPILPFKRYPLRSCKVESEPKICGRGFNAYKTIAE